MSLFGKSDPRTKRLDKRCAAWADRRRNSRVDVVRNLISRENASSERFTGSTVFFF